MNHLFNSVRWRLQLWHALILLGVIAALCVLAYRLAVDDRRERIDRELESFERAFMRSFWDITSRKNKEGLPGGKDELRERFRSLADGAEFPLEMRDLFDPEAKESIYLSFWDGNGQTLFRSANAPESLNCPKLPPPNPDPQARLRGNFRELVQSGPRGFRSLVGRDVSNDRVELHRLGLQIAGSGALLWLLGLLGGWWLAGRAIQPIEAISQTASRIAGGKVSERIDIAGTDNELTRLSQVLNETFDRLAASIERQREFTADASHELRTPLTVILSETSRGLKRERSAEEYQEIISNCGHAATRMRGLVESLLLLVRQDGSPEIRRENVDLASIASDSIQLLQPLADRHGIRIFPNLRPTRCIADPNALSIVVGNLLSNAISHQPDGGEVSITVSTKDQNVLIEVSDKGPGISAEHLPRLFDRFYRVDPARGPSSGHSGLGLAIVQAIVENHHGIVEVKSSPGEGSTFFVILPVAPA
ncbi:MAG: HAMP domain-containing protein [Verrucomicrobiaceae bacterium]|nr:MAG: HAMP domain-containing protein [Verrucomicrobiaceae bacterium]